LFAGTQFSGIATQTYSVDVSLDPGEYFFQCDVHPTEMTGTFVAVKAKG
jgi:plastocyanin